MAAKQNLGKMSRGDNKVVQFVLDGRKLPSDGVTGFSFWFTAKTEVGLPDASAQFRKVGVPGNLGPFAIVAVGDPAEPSGAVDAVVTCDLVPSDTDSLPDYDVTLEWDLQVKDANGKVSTSARGTLTVQPDITRAS